MKKFLLMCVVGFFLLPSAVQANPLGLFPSVQESQGQQLHLKSLRIETPQLGTTRLLQRKASSPLKASFGTSKQSLDFCGLISTGCGGMSGIGFILIVVPVMTALTLATLIGNIVVLARQKNRMGMGIAGVIMSVSGIAVGTAVSLFDGGTAGLLITLLMNIPMLALSCFSIFKAIQKRQAVYHTSIYPWFRVSRNGSPMGGFAIGGKF